jgi:hypothetical protein
MKCMEMVITTIRCSSTSPMHLCRTGCTSLTIWEVRVWAQTPILICNTISALSIV